MKKFEVWAGVPDDMEYEGTFNSRKDAVKYAKDMDIYTVGTRIEVREVTSLVTDSFKVIKEIEKA
jgi:hypothetical protein